MDLQEMILAKAGAAKEAAQSMNMLSTVVKNEAKSPCQKEPLLRNDPLSK